MRREREGGEAAGGEGCGGVFFLSLPSFLLPHPITVTGQNFPSSFLPLPSHHHHHSTVIITGDRMEERMNLSAFTEPKNKSTTTTLIVGHWGIFFSISPSFVSLSHHHHHHHCHHRPCHHVRYVQGWGMRRGMRGGQVAGKAGQK